MRIGIAGITGRVGRLLADLVVERGHELAGGTGGSAGLIEDLARSSDIVIDFSHANAVVRHASALSAAGTPWVLGTTGLDAEAASAVDRAALRIGVIQAANFSPGIAIVTALARRLGAALTEADYDAEILEMHHRGKRDAPSGTALSIGRAVADGRGRAFEDVAQFSRAGQILRRPGEIGFAVQRGGGIVGEHALSFTAASERITLRHEAFDRRVFADGALRAACWLIGHPPGRYEFEEVLGLASQP